MSVLQLSAHRSSITQNVPTYLSWPTCASISAGWIPGWESAWTGGVHSTVDRFTRVLSKQVPDWHAQQKIHTPFCALTATFPILNISMGSLLILEFKRKKNIGSSSPRLHGLLVLQLLMRG